MALNIGQIFELVATVAIDVEVDEATLAAGAPVQIPLEPQVGTVGGKPIYLVATLSTTKSTSSPSPVASS